MTEQQITEASRMWAKGATIKAISARVGIPVPALSGIIRDDRNNFPKRHNWFGKRTDWHFAGNGTMEWTTDLGAKVTLPAISFLMDREVA
jgi:hypothetical protein